MAIQVEGHNYYKSNGDLLHDITLNGRCDGPGCAPKEPVSNSYALAKAALNDFLAYSNAYQNNGIRVIALPDLWSRIYATSSGLAAMQHLINTIRKYENDLGRALGCIIVTTAVSGTTIVVFRKSA